VVILPLLAFPLAVAVDKMGKVGWGKWIVRLMFTAGTLLLWVLSSVPALCFTSARERVEQVIGAKLGMNPLFFLPDLARGTPTGQALALGSGLTVLFALLVLLLVHSLKRRR